jgi:hypothetical protein
VKTFLAALVLAAWTAIALYGGVATFMANKALEDVSSSVADQGAIVYKTSAGVPLSFRDATELRRFLSQERVGRWFPWVVDVPFSLVPAALACAFALLGSLIAILSTLVSKTRRLHETPFFSRPLFGMGIGLMLFFLSLILPAVLTTGWDAARTETVAALALFGGILAEHTYKWILEKAREQFPLGSGEQK